MIRKDSIRSILGVRALWIAVIVFGCVLTTAGCDNESGLPPAGIACSDLSPQPAIVSDIDETLTLSDAEWVRQLLEDDYVPVAREGSVALIHGYFERGYRILYLTARPETLTLFDGTPAREATEAWLLEMGFPMAPERTRLVLAPDTVSGDAAALYKQGAIESLTAEGWGFAFAFGNATTDIDGYAAAGIPLEATFIIGRHAGENGTVAIVGEAWTDHIDTQLVPMGRICDF